MRSSTKVGKRSARVSRTGKHLQLRKESRPARSINADARVRFLAIERFARLPIAEQAKRLPQFYRNLDARTLSIIVEGILSSYPHDILKGYQQDDPVVSRNSIPTEPADAQ